MEIIKYFMRENKELVKLYGTVGQFCSVHFDRISLIGLGGGT